MKRNIFTSVFSVKNQHDEPLWFRVLMVGFALLMAALALTLVSAVSLFWYQQLHNK